MTGQASLAILAFPPLQVEQIFAKRSSWVRLGRDERHSLGTRLC